MKKYWVLVPLLTGVLACDAQEEASSVATLDAFAAGKSSSQSCYGEGLDETTPILFGQDVSSSRRAALRRAAQVSLAAVPANLRSFFKRNGGAIKISGVASQICSDAFRKEDADFAVDADDVAACLTVLKGDGDQQEDLAIMMKDDESEVSANIVRMFGYYVAQYLSRLYRGEDGQLTLDDLPSESFRKERSKVAAYFLSDLASSRTYNLQAMESFLGAGAAETVRYNLERGHNLYENITFQHLGEELAPDEQRRAVRLESFEGFIYAHAFDSYYCNQRSAGASNTRKAMRQDFPGAYRQFVVAYAKVDAYLETAKPDLNAYSPDSWESPSGFALQTDAGEGTDSVVATPPATTQPPATPSTPPPANATVGTVDDNFVVGNDPTAINNGQQTININISNLPPGVEPVVDVSSTGDGPTPNLIFDFDTNDQLVTNPDAPVTSVVDPTTTLPPLEPPTVTPDSQVGGITPTQNPVQTPVVSTPEPTPQPVVSTPQPITQPIMSQPPQLQPLYPPQSSGWGYPSSGCGGGGGYYGNEYGNGYWG